MSTEIKSYIESFEPPTETGQYRIVDRGTGYEPQMSYTLGRVEGLAWFPLNGDGYWLEPEAFTSGELSKCSCMPLSIARRAIQRAMAANGVHLRCVPQQTGSASK